MPRFLLIIELLRKTALTLLTWILLVHVVTSALGDGDVAEYYFPGVKILEGDIFMVALSPPTQNIQVYVKGAEMKDFSLLVLTNSSLGIPILMERVSLVQIIPESSATNLTVTFNSNSTVKMLYGILTTNYTYYRQVSSDYYTFSNGILVVLQPQTIMPQGASKVTFVLKKVSTRRTGIDFLMQLPPLATILPFAAAVIILAYLNAYVIVDSYYVSKREELSRARKLGLILLIALSALIIYWLLNNFVKY